MSGESQTAELKSQQVPEITEAMILEWQQNPDEALLEAIRSGEVLLLSKSRQQQIIGNITARDERLQEVSQQLADIQMRYALLLESMYKLLKSCEGIAQVAPEAVELIQGMKIVSAKGGINWTAVMGIAGDFVMDNARAKRIKAVLEKIQNGFDQKTFASIHLEQLLGIMRENNMDLSGFDEVAKIIMAVVMQKEVNNG